LELYAAIIFLLLFNILLLSFLRHKFNWLKFLIILFLCLLNFGLKLYRHKFWRFSTSIFKWLEFWLITFFFLWFCWIFIFYIWLLIFLSYFGFYFFLFSRRLLIDWGLKNIICGWKTCLKRQIILTYFLRTKAIEFECLIDFCFFFQNILKFVFRIFFWRW
jgi:hypothetical protein